MVKKGAESCNFQTDSCKIATDDIVGAQNFNVAFPQNGIIFSCKFSIFGQKFSDRKNILD